MVNEREEIVALQQELSELRAEFAKTASLVKKIHRHTVMATALRFLWIGVIVGIPIIAYIFAGSFIEVAANYINTLVHDAIGIYMQQYIGNIGR